MSGADLAYLLGDWSPSACGTSCISDIVTSATFEPPPDGVVDGADLAYMLGSWGECVDPRTCQVEESLLGGDPNPLEDETLGEPLLELIETSDAELAEEVAALLAAWMGGS